MKVRHFETDALNVVRGFHLLLTISCLLSGQRTNGFSSFQNHHHHHPNILQLLQQGRSQVSIPKCIQHHGRHSVHQRKPTVSPSCRSSPLHFPTTPSSSSTTALSVFPPGALEAIVDTTYQAGDIVSSTSSAIAAGSSDLEILGRDIFTFLVASVVVVPLAKTLKVSPVLGFLLVGCILGPFGLATFSNNAADLELGDFGILFLLFNEGLALTPERIQDLNRFSTLGLIQLVTAIALFSSGIIFGGQYILDFVEGLGVPLNDALLRPILDSPVQAFSIAAAGALSSSAFVLPVLSQKKWKDRPEGIAGLSILLLQDLAVAPLLVIIPLLAGSGPQSWSEFGLLLAKASLGFGTVLVFGSYILRYVFDIVASARSTETFVAAALLVAIGMGQYTDFLGLSATTGAFAAGVLLAGNRYRAQIQADIKPFEGILLGVFFMTAGAQLDPNVVIDEWPTLLTGILAFIVTKALIVFASGPTLGLTKGQAARVAVTLSGGGEFAFVLFTLAKSLGVLPTDLAKLLTASVIISMSLTPLLAEAGAFLGNYFDNTSGDQFERSLSLAEANAFFDGIDEDKSGFIDIDELGKALSRQGFNYATIAEVFDQFDANRDGVISREEWKLGLETGLLNEALALDRKIPEADVNFRQDAIVICGYGEVGKSLFETIQATGRVKEGGIVVFDLNPTRVTAGVLQGAPVVFGDPARLDLMRAAGVKNPKAVIVTYASDSRRVEATSRLRNSLPSTTPIFAMEGANHVTQQLLDAGATTVISQTTETVLRFTSLLGIVSEPEDLTRLRESFRTKELKAATNGEVNEFEERHMGMNKLQFLDLASEVGCTRAELEELYDEFYSISIAAKDTVAIKDLKEMIMRMASNGPSDGTALDRCMNFKDEDGSGELTFEEFVRAYFDDTCEVGFESSRVSSVPTGPLVESSTPITTFSEQP